MRRRSRTATISHLGLPLVKCATLDGDHCTFNFFQTVLHSLSLSFFVTHTEGEREGREGREREREMISATTERAEGNWRLARVGLPLPAERENPLLPLIFSLSLSLFLSWLWNCIGTLPY